MNEPIALGIPPQQNEDNLIDLGPTATQPITAEQATLKATKIDQSKALPDKSYDDIYQTLTAGDEGTLRAQMAAQEDYNKRIKEQLIIQKFAENNGPVTPEVRQQIADIVKGDKPTDPDTVVEDKYANYYMSTLNWPNVQNEDSFMSEAYRNIPTQVEAMKDVGKTLMVKREIALDLQDKYRQIAEDQSWGGWLVDLGKSAIPLYTDAKLRGQVDKVSRFYGLLGTNLDEQRRELYKLPQDEFKQKLSGILETLSQDNPALAKSFADAMVGQTSKEQALNDVFSAIDAASVPGLGVFTKGLLKSTSKAAKAITGTSTELKKAVADVVVSHAENITADPAARAAAAGDIGEAAVKKNTATLSKTLSGDVDAAVKDGFETLPAALRADQKGIGDNATNLASGAINLLHESYDRFIDKMMNTIVNVTKIQRIPGALATETALKAIKEDIKTYYPGLSNSLLDVGDIVHNPISNTYSVTFKLGTLGNDLFPNKDAAEFFIKRKKLEGAEVVKAEQQGKGYYVKIQKPFSETSDIIRDGLIKSYEASQSQNGGVRGWVNAIAGIIRTPEDVLSATQVRNRKTATYAAAEVRKFVHEETKAIQDLANGVVKFDPITNEPLDRSSRTWSRVMNMVPGKKNERWESFERTLRANQDMFDPANPEQKGYFFKNVGELQSFYKTTFDRLPSLEEIDAYFAHTRLMEFDRTLRNISVYRNKARLGAEQHRFYSFDPVAKGRVYSQFFDGMVLNHLPGGDDTVLVAGTRLGGEKVFFGGSMPPKYAETLRKGIKSGEYKVIEIFDPEARPLETWGESAGSRRVRYVVTKNVESKPLSWEQVPRRGGGHFDYDYSHYIKQAKIRPENLGKTFKYWYEGDTTLMPVESRAVGKDLVNKLEKVRLLLKAGDEVGAKTFAKSNLGDISWQDIRGWFSETIDKETGKKLPPRFSKSEPFHVVEKDKSIIDIDKDALEARYRKGTFHDGTRSGSAARAFQTSYTQERDSYGLFTLKDEGTKRNPVYKNVPADMVDPISSMNRALRRIIDSTFMDDYKVSSVEHWIAENGKYLTASESELKSAPFYHFVHPVFKPLGSENTKGILNARVQRFMIQQFIGRKSIIGNVLYAAAQDLADMAYKYAGPKWAGRLASGAELASTKNPISFIRGMTFHMKLGLFNVPQILVQNMTYASIYGVAGSKYAVPGTAAAFLHSWGRINKSPEILRALDERISKFRIPGTSHWKPGEFMEAFEEGNKTGFFHVGSEYSMKDDWLDPQVISSKGKQLLKSGDIFFNMGERSVRQGAWYTAFKEWRDKNPFGRITDKERQIILDRADLLSVNMSRASSSTLHTGIMSWPGQFLSYQLRQAELFMSPRITWKERGRLLAWNAGLFGAPIATGVSGMPLADYLREYALDNGYVVGDPFLTSVMEGLPSYMAQLITGGGNLAKGTSINLGARYGNQGFEWLREFLRSDKAWWEILGGASWSTVSNMAASTDGFYQGALALIRGDQNYFPLTVDDFVQPFKEISSINTAYRGILAANTGKWISKQGLTLTDGVSPALATIMSLTGTQPTEAQDINLYGDLRKNREEVQKEAIKKFTLEFRRGIEASADNNPQAWKAYWRRARSYLEIADFPPERIAEAIRIATKGFETMADNMDFSFFTRNVPASEQKSKYDTLRRKMKMRNERKNGE